MKLYFYSTFGMWWKWETDICWGNSSSCETRVEVCKDKLWSFLEKLCLFYFGQYYCPSNYTDSRGSQSNPAEKWAGKGGLKPKSVTLSGPEGAKDLLPGTVLLCCFILSVQGSSSPSCLGQPQLTRDSYREYIRSNGIQAREQ